MLGALLLAASRAAAAPAGEPPPGVGSFSPAPPKPKATVPPRAPPAASARARQHYERALERYDAGDHAAALGEFRQAHALMGSHQLLFNIGQLEFRLERYAEAHRTLERYLNEGAGAIAPERRERVLAQLTELRGHMQRAAATPFDPARDDPELGVKSTARTAPPPAPAHGRAVLASGSPRATPHPLVTPAWVGAGVLGLAAVGCGVATVLTSRHYDELRAQPAEPGEAERTRRALDEQRSLVSALATTTDVLAVATLASASLGLYFTLRGGSAGEAEPQLSLLLRGDGVLATGSF